MWHAAGSKAADSASGDGTGGEPDALAGPIRQIHSRNRRALPKVLENLELAKELLGQPTAHHDQHGDRAMERE